MKTATVKVIQTAGLEGRKDMESRELAEYCASLCLDKKAQNVIILDLRDQTTIADYFIVASGSSQPQVQTISENVLRSLRKFGHKPLREEGVQDGRWALIDLGDIMVHVFQEQMREFYDLEGLWQEAPRMRVEDGPSTSID